MIKFLKKFWTNLKLDESNVQKEHPSYTLLKKALPKDFDLNNVKEIIFLFAIEYNENVYEELKLAINEERIFSFVKGHKFDSLKDALQIFLIKEEGNNQSIIIQYSPVEFFENEYIMDYIRFDSLLDDSMFEDSEVIYNLK